ncbi:MAG: tyrosine-type recombinase/integrase [Acidimicrobiales bacterium]
MAGSKRQLAPGKWELRCYVGKDPITGNPRQVSKTFYGKEREAEKALAAHVTKILGKKEPDHKRTVGALLDRWLEDCERRLSPTTVANYSQFSRLYLKPALKDYRVDKLGSEDLDRLYLALERKGAGPHTIRHVHATIRSALSQAKRWKWVTENVANDARPTPLPEADVSAPSPQQVRALVAAIEPSSPDLATLVLLAALTGLRRGELCALRWSDVDWSVPAIVVSHNRVVAAGKVVDKAPKSRRRRTVVLDQLGVVLLERLRALQLERSAASGIKSLPDGWLISVEGCGVTPRRPDNVGRQLTRLSRKAGIPLGLHKLRHYSATELIGAGVDVRTVADRLGHADPSLTLRVYSHAIDARAHEAAAMLGRGLKEKNAKKPPAEAGG